MTVADPTLRLERRLLREGASMVIGVDEVGRGAIAGPVGVGLSVFDGHGRRIPEGLRDSKMLPEPTRERLHPIVQTWSTAHAVGLASNDEIEEVGIIVALGIAAMRAFAGLLAGGLVMQDAVILLDGSHDWLSPVLDRAEPIARGAAVFGGARPPVTMRVKADRDCAVVAAASVLAKVHRDRVMIAADGTHPGYGWTGNKGYASAEHYAAIDRLGPTPLHRVSWLRTPSLLDGLLA
ncbi:ribonuclease HII [Pseudolysinimonas kribbensis]|uniref:Ribonuclease n=1 Tax=Pseudolysinimonas kribbensis TaxID=433641 RepID=A0ABQ6K039_9MICO|nr:ribonuclease HII [Pseudolysinimonas kribbensis]GMA93956.1 ribonuclease [Pseudolysinimonas kribbensis]